MFGVLTSAANRYVSDGVPLAKLMVLEVTACGSTGFQLISDITQQSVQRALPTLR